MQSRFSDLVCQPLVTSYVVDAYLSLAMLHAWTLEYQHNDDLRLMMDTCTKAESQWSAGEDLRVALATSGSTRFRRIPALYCCLRFGDLRSSGVTEWRNGPLGLRDDDDDVDDLPHTYYSEPKWRQSADPHITHPLLTKVFDLVNEV